jgi:hypothetical protein
MRGSLLLSLTVLLVTLADARAEEPGEREAAAVRRLLGDGGPVEPLSPEQVRDLSREAMDLLQKRELAEAEKRFRRIVASCSFDATAHYNLACLLSLSGKADGALDHLERSIRAGYRDVEHMKADSDLEAIREDKRFADLIRLAGSGAALPDPADLRSALALAREECGVVVVFFVKRDDAASRALLDAPCATDAVRFEVDVAAAADRLGDTCPKALSVWVLDADGTWLDGRAGDLASGDLAAFVRQAAARRPLPDLGTPVLSAPIRKYLAEKHLGGCDPASKTVDEAVEILELPASALREISRLSWTRRQLGTFVPDKVFLLVKTTKGETRAIHFRSGGRRQDKVLGPAEERVVRRLYSEELYTRAPAPALGLWRKKTDLVPKTLLETLITRIGAAPDFALDAETLERARRNLMASAGEGRELAIALGALSETEHGDECVWAGLWLVSRLDAMVFRRHLAARSIPDLATVTARLFYENVFYAVRARHEFPWGRAVEQEDFLQHVISPRSTGEPLQRWRRPFFEAIAPELREFLADDVKKAIGFANKCCYAFYQYEGATTWEDFGMLSSLAVHEGRCEDCSNVQNSFVRAIGLPAAQAFTPFWGHANGNHAWTVVPSVDGAKNRNGVKAVKVFVKTWDALVDVTDKNTKVTTVRVATKGAGRAALRVWNQGSWRVVARADIVEGQAVFEKVGCARDFVLGVAVPGESDRLVLVAKGGPTHSLRNPATVDPGESAFEYEFDKSGPLGEFEADREYRLQVHTSGGWADLPAERADTGAIRFAAESDRLYRIVAKGITPRPFVIARGETEFDVEIRKL